LTVYDESLQLGIDQTKKLLGAYLQPAVYSFSYGMSNGWFNTAKTHQTLGFDVVISTNVVFVPDAHQHFIFESLVYNNVTVEGEKEQMPTILGPADAVGLNYSYYNESTGMSLSGSQDIKGLGLYDDVGNNVFPSPMVQVGLGTIKNTDVMFRYMPKLNYGDYSASAIGFGIKHDIMQWFSGDKPKPLDVSIMAAYSGLNNTLDLTELNFPGEDQEAWVTLNNWTINALVSKDVSIVTFYSGIGYSFAKARLQAKGIYRIEDQYNPIISLALVDPVDLNYDLDSFRATLGVKLNISFVTLHCDYTFQEYQVLSAGIGFSYK
jgi:hypothetical protein